ncbi:MAG TPA: tetratricopeptide repeat protein [Steroidobacteraceae bacterium]|nr:tetratricopeptide repeat protein [Steroidobacteraceae bacterium]
MFKPGFMAAGLLSLCLAGCGLFDTPARQMQRAEDALTRGDYGEAAVILRSLADGEPERGDVWLLLARTLHMQGDAAGAERVLQQAVDNGAPAGGVAVLRAEQRLVAGNFQQLLDAVGDEAIPLDAYQRRYYRARALQGLRRTPEALTIYQQLAAEQDSPELQLRIAQCHAFHGRDQLAMAALDKAPGMAEGWLLKLDLARRNRDNAAASEALRKAIETAPGQLTAPEQGQLLLIGVDQALRAGDAAAAEAHRASLVKLLPQAPVTRLAIAQVQLHTAGTASGITSELQRLLQEQPNYQPARGVLIAALLRTGSLELALKEANTLAIALAPNPEPQQVQEAIRAATAEAPDSAERQLNIAAALLALQQPALARLQLQEALQKHPDGVDLKVAMVRIEVAAGRTSEAIQLAQDFATERPQESGGSVLVAQAQEAAGDFAAAAATYERLWRDNPTGPLTLTLAQVRTRAGLTVADLPLRQWLARYPGDRQIRQYLATALQQSGDHAGAVREFERVVAGIHPAHPVRPIALNNLAVAYSLVGDPRALQTARSAHELASTVPNVQDTYGWLLVQAGRLPEALPLLQAAAAGLPDSPEVRYHLAAALAQAGQKDEARVLLADTLLDTQPFDERAEAERLLASL